MNKTFNDQNIYAIDDSTSYYGELTLFDFEGHQTMKSMTDKIIRDWNFDKQCRQNEENRKRMAEKQCCQNEENRKHMAEKQYCQNEENRKRMAK